MMVACCSVTEVLFGSSVFWQVGPVGTEPGTHADKSQSNWYKIATIQRFRLNSDSDYGAVCSRHSKAITK